MPKKTTTLKTYFTEFKCRGATWSGPTFRAETWDEAQALVDTYPIKGMKVCGVACCSLAADMAVVTYYFDPKDKVTVGDIECFLQVHRQSAGFRAKVKAENAARRKATA
jgi:hypothetical protein